jgi:hypothetical protein
MPDYLTFHTPAPTYRPPGTQIFGAYTLFLDSTKLKEDIMAKRDSEVPGRMRKGFMAQTIHPT